MQTRKVECFKNLLFIALCFYPLLSYGAIAYIPQLLKECIGVVNSVVSSTDSKKHVEDLSAIIAENRMLASDIIARDAVQEAIEIVEKNSNKFKVEDQRKAVAHYLKTYLHGLDDKSVLLPISGDNANVVSWPVSLVSRSLFSGYSNKRSVGFDIMRLSSELVSLDSIQLCGLVDFENKNAGMVQLISDVFKEINQEYGVHRDVLFNANMMNNSVSNFPDIVFGTGASSSSINAWIINPSSMMQSPINIQFSIPADFNIRDIRSHEKVSLELHFLVTQAPANPGHVRFQVQSKFLEPHHSFAIETANPPYTNTAYSHNIMVTEPTAANSVKHMVAHVPLKHSHIHANDMAFLSVTRSVPTKGSEYMGDVYLAAAVFTYSS